MSKQVVNSAFNVMMVIYSFVIIAACVVGGNLKEQWYIDGGEIKNVCDVLRVIVVDDSREAFAIGTLVLMVPVIIYAAINKFKIISMNIMLVFFILVWVWYFIIKYRNCLWF